MNYSTAIFLISDECRAVMAIYEADELSGKKAARTMFKTLDPDVKVGDLVIVPTDTRHGMTVVKVTDVDVEPDLQTSADIKWVVDKIDADNFDNLKAQEDAAIASIKSAEKRKQREELRKALIADAADDLKALPIYTAGDKNA